MWHRFPWQPGWRAVWVSLWSEEHTTHASEQPWNQGGNADIYSLSRNKAVMRSFLKRLLPLQIAQRYWNTALVVVNASGSNFSVIFRWSFRFKIYTPDEIWSMMISCFLFFFFFREENLKFLKPKTKIPIGVLSVYVWGLSDIEYCVSEFPKFVFCFSNRLVYWPQKMRTVHSVIHQNAPFIMFWKSLTSLWCHKGRWQLCQDSDIRPSQLFVCCPSFQFVPNVWKVQQGNKSAWAESKCFINQRLWTEG